WGCTCPAGQLGGRRSTISQPSSKAAVTCGQRRPGSATSSSRLGSTPTPAADAPAAMARLSSPLPGTATTEPRWSPPYGNRSRWAGKTGSTRSRGWLADATPTCDIPWCILDTIECVFDSVKLPVGRLRHQPAGTPWARQRFARMCGTRGHAPGAAHQMAATARPCRSDAAANLRVGEPRTGESSSVAGDVWHAVLRVTAEVGDRPARNDVTEIPRAAERATLAQRPERVERCPQRRGGAAGPGGDIAQRLRTGRVRLE